MTFVILSLAWLCLPVVLWYAYQLKNAVQLSYDNAGPEVYTLQADGEPCIDESSEGMSIICLCQK